MRRVPHPWWFAWGSGFSRCFKRSSAFGLCSHPTSFYSSFPLPGHPWVSLLPPYNEHLVRDVGELSLALTVVLAAAAVIGQRLLSAVAVAAIAVYAVPHAIFHFLHLEGFPTSDAIAQTVGIALQLVVIAAVALLLWRDRQHSA
jgi:heme/copper-type cytochrome/quinol oxidase subunit 4